MFNDPNCLERVENSFPAILKSTNAFESGILESFFWEYFPQIDIALRLIVRQTVTFTVNVAEEQPSRILFSNVFVPLVTNFQLLHLRIIIRLELLF